MADTSSTTPANPSTTPSADAPAALSDEQRSNPRYLEVFKAVIGACFAKASSASDAVDAALEATDACYVKLFGATAAGEGKSIIPEGLLHEPHHPNLDPACPQRLPDEVQNPGDAAPVTPPDPAKPEVPAAPEATPAADPVAGDAANPAPAEPASSDSAAPSVPSSDAEPVAHDPAADVSGEFQAPKL